MALDTNSSRPVAQPQGVRRTPGRPIATERSTPSRHDADGAPPMCPDPHRPSRNLTATDIMTAAEVAELLTVAPTTVYEWARAGTLPALRRGRVVRFRRWEVEAWIAGELDRASALGTTARRPVP